MMPWLYCGLGLVILLLAGDALVRGAVNLSLRLGVPALIVSLTIVAFGTSAPELLIAISAVMEGADGIAMGNVVGSNTANILLVLGVPAILMRLDTSKCATQKNYVYMLIASVLFIALAFVGVFTLWSGLILLAALAIVLGGAFREARAHRRNRNGNAEAADDLEDIEEADPDMPFWRIGVYLVLGLVGLPLGADLLVDNATIIARMYGISETVIGLTLVAIGTSLPELATTVMAALRRQADVALGNVIGSNMFNLLAIIGVATFVGPISVDPEFLRFDLWVMLAASLLIFPFVFFKMDITRRWGGLLTGLYVLYLWVLL
ncbi:K+-dependent Na+/Ca+ exchanger [Phaeobacter gallaeciensis]|jgi:cation:H+ antiporter|uniref:Calcium/sodium antiporter n=1 Tax=Phaeobacter gallaeciensis TaxID=60890 RepID=A0A1B0ZQ88_9RHOB|nr:MULTISPECIES: calcium/sodium antiporter [Phaeobacter]MDF1772187.1 calcium/sodium antiporter [Pseudophaeobacter sp. bin_em_oilr2.035]ANP36244.1 K+-dependent Na+/Ca+ exchanger [Phaeobacter gallaeciensis]MDE4060717.1 calcium/sodium antiporter [Phaeobacter gallaeciensis]MDE4123856.1 calcium/sodium antiporter [Phaeobacter gallaeciensis]MDE4128206.1 calcium/sodium antiporter [Phaeobacter gallaeciensis]